MHWSDIPFDPSRTTLRQFAGLWLVFFGGMALWQALVRGHIGLASILGRSRPDDRPARVGSP